MGKALYRKYRSTTLDEVVGQEHITEALKSAIRSGKISHAYLLTGPKGVGKTSVARILAHMVNDLPYSEEPHLDIIEIDAASNRRIDEIRDLREHVYASPASAKYKVFIIDEVHMLTKEAFNALLKTLEEPPEHVIFILATTETHKLPETIISRTQRFAFRPVALEKVITHLRNIADKEGISVEDEALELIAKHGEGSFRDSISLLDQASSSSGATTTSTVQSLLGQAPQEALESLFDSLRNGEHGKIVQKIEEMIGQGYEPSVVAMQISSQLRGEITGKTASKSGLSTPKSLDLLAKLLDVPGSFHPTRSLELVLLQSATSPDEPVASVIEQTSSKPKTELKPRNDHIDKHRPNLTEQKLPSVSSEAEVGLDPFLVVSEDKDALKHKTKSSKNDLTSNSPSLNKSNKPNSDLEADELWSNVLDEIKKTHNTLYGVARMAKPRLEGNCLYLRLSFSFHHKQLNTPKNNQILLDSISKFRKKPTQLSIELNQEPDQSKKNDDVTNISNIFGGAELL